MNRKILLFDMDGTLLDSMHMWNNFLDLFENYKPKDELDFSLDLSKSSSLSYSVNLVKNTLEENISEEKIANKIHSFLLDFYSAKNRSKNQVENVLQKLFNQGFEIYLATATDFEYAKAGVIKSGLYPYLSKLYTPDVLGIKKHTIDYYKEILDELKANPKEITFVDDASYALKFAKEVGFNTIGIFDSNSFEHDLVEQTGDFYIEEMDEILEILKKIYS